MTTIPHEHLMNAIRASRAEIYRACERTEAPEVARILRRLEAAAASFHQTIHEEIDALGDVAIASGDGVSPGDLLTAVAFSLGEVMGVTLKNIYPVRDESENGAFLIFGKQLLDYAEGLLSAEGGGVVVDESGCSNVHTASTGKAN